MILNKFLILDKLLCIGLIILLDNVSVWYFNSFLLNDIWLDVLILQYIKLTIDVVTELTQFIIGQRNRAWTSTFYNALFAVSIRGKASKEPSFFVVLEEFFSFFLFNSATHRLYLISINVELSSHD